MDSSTPDSNNNEGGKKKVIRDGERKRRQEMAARCASLASHLPLQSIKEKASSLDHINAAVNYIKYLQDNVKELCVRRDEVKELCNKCESSCVGVYPFLGGVKIVFSNGLDEEKLRLSKVVAFLLEERLDVVSCVSTKVNQRLLHTVHSEVRDLANFNLAELQRKVNNL